MESIKLMAETVPGPKLVSTLCPGVSVRIVSVLDVELLICNPPYLIRNYIAARPNYIPEPVTNRLRESELSANTECFKKQTTEISIAPVILTPVALLYSASVASLKLPTTGIAPVIPIVVPIELRLSIEQCLCHSLKPCLGNAKLLKTNSAETLYRNWGNKIWEMAADKRRQLGGFTKDESSEICRGDQ